MTVSYDFFCECCAGSARPSEDARTFVCACPYRKTGIHFSGTCASSGGRFHLPERREIVGDAALEIIFRLVTEFLACARDVVDAGRGIGEAIEVQTATDLHLRIRDVLLDDALEVAQGHADAGTDVVEAALELADDSREIDAERGILVVDEVVLVVATLLQLERQALRRVLDDPAHYRHRPVPRRLARPVGRSEAQRHGLHAHIVVVIRADVLAHELGRVVDALGLGRKVLRHRLPGRRPILAGDRAIDALGAGEDHALHVERPRRLEHVHQTHDVDLDAQGRVAR